MNKVINIISNIITYATILIVICCAVLIGPTFLGYKSFIVRSGSMEPIIHTGSIAYVNTKFDNVEVNDIVTFKIGEDTIVTHRIVDKIDDTNFKTKGDANDVEDASILNKSNIIGIYKYQIPNLGYAVAKLNKKMIVVIVIWIMIINMMSIVLSSIFKEKDEEKTSEKTSSEVETEEKHNT